MVLCIGEFCEDKVKCIYLIKLGGLELLVIWF